MAKALKRESGAGTLEAPTPLVLPERRVGGRELADVFLPVDADNTLTAVLGTAFLLANDDALTDQAILSQLPE